MEHRIIPVGQRHPAHDWEFADAAARLAAVVTEEQVGRLAIQVDNDSLWWLKDHDPVTWNGLSGLPDGVAYEAGVLQVADTIRTFTLRGIPGLDYSGGDVSIQPADDEGGNGGDLLLTCKFGGSSHGRIRLGDIDGLPILQVFTDFDTGDKMVSLFDGAGATQAASADITDFASLKAYLQQRGDIGPD